MRRNRQGAGRTSAPSHDRWLRSVLRRNAFVATIREPMLAVAVLAPVLVIWTDVKEAAMASGTRSLFPYPHPRFAARQKTMRKQAFVERHEGAMPRSMF